MSGSKKPNEEKLLAFLQERQKAYQLVFYEKNTFLKPVLDDLAKFCRANESCFHQDPRAHAVMEGRREVWLRIRDHINMSLDELFERYGKGKS